MTIELLNADCMEYMATQADNSFDLAIVDPPYFDGPARLGYYGSVKSKTKVHRQSYNTIAAWDVPKDKYFNDLLRVSKDQIIWGYNYFKINNLGDGRIIWDKINDASTFSDGEIAYCSKIKTVRFYRYMWNGMLQGDMKNKEHRIHPTQKPVKLYEWLLTNYAKEGDRILDTHLGSGSSAIAAHYFGVDFVGCEIDEDYYKASVKRFEAETAQLDLLS